MADMLIAQKDFYTQAVTASPSVFNNLGRFERLIFASGSAITKVEISNDGVAYFDITSDTQHVNLVTAGLAIITDLCAQYYRIT